jgi:hypothetical protein
MHSSCSPCSYQHKIRFAPKGRLPVFSYISTLFHRVLIAQCNDRDRVSLLLLRFTLANLVNIRVNPDAKVAPSQKSTILSRKVGTGKRPAARQRRSGGQQPSVQLDQMPPHGKQGADEAQSRGAGYQQQGNAGIEWSYLEIRRIQMRKLCQCRVERLKRQRHSG